MTSRQIRRALRCLLTRRRRCACRLPFRAYCRHEAVRAYQLLAQDAKLRGDVPRQRALLQRAHDGRDYNRTGQWSASIRAAQSQAWAIMCETNQIRAAGAVR